MPDSAVDDLQVVLDKVEGFARLHRPALHTRFRPGLPDSELELLAQRLEPYYLPTELVALYRWHDGWQSDAIRCRVPRTAAIGRPSPDCPPSTGPVAGGTRSASPRWPRPPKIS